MRQRKKQSGVLAAVALALACGQPVLGVDAVFDPIFGESDPAFVGDIDSLYASRAYGNEVRNQPSSYHNKLVGLRWHDPSPKPVHGRIQWFAFPLYYMNDAEAQDTFNKSLDWFRAGP